MARCSMENLSTDVKKLIFRCWFRIATLDEQRLCCPWIGPGRLNVPRELREAIDRVPQRLHRSWANSIVSLPGVIIQRDFGTQTFDYDAGEYGFADVAWYTRAGCMTGTLQVESVQGATAMCTWYIVLFTARGILDSADITPWPSRHRFRVPGAHVGI